MDTASTVAVPERRILMIPEHAIGAGSGHLRRCALLAGDLGPGVEWLLAPPDAREHHGPEAIRAIVGGNLPGIDFTHDLRGSYDLTVIDRRSMDHSEIADWSRLGFTVGLDAPSGVRRHLHYLIDLLPAHPDAGEANLTDPGLLPLPERVRSEWPTSLKRILIAFGGEGGSAAGSRAAGLARDLLTVCAASGHGDLSITFVGPVPGLADAPDDPRITRRPAVPGLAEELAHYDLVVTHFGLLAYESVWARVPVVLVNPSAYHERLSRTAGFPTATDARGVMGWSADRSDLIWRCELLRPSRRHSLADTINALELPRHLGPPLDPGNLSDEAVARFPERSYFRHAASGILYAIRSRGTGIAYHERYFMDEYRQQYGRTYLEDFEHITELGRSRIRFIERYLRAGSRTSRPSLLDLGCAYGPFLAAAGERGWLVTGADISQEALAYVRATFGYETAHVDLSAPLPQTLAGRRFDVVTMWYVIEHFANLDSVLRNVAALTVPGGIFAFSSPHAAGVSARRNFKDFLNASPADHFTVLERKSVATLLGRYGFRLLAFRSTGHHPERFGLPAGLGARPGLLQSLLRLYSRCAARGDTFEAVAVREERR